MLDVIIYYIYDLMMPSHNVLLTGISALTDSFIRKRPVAHGKGLISDSTPHEVSDVIMNSFLSTYRFP